MRSLRVNGYDMACVEQGAGEPILLVHGSLSGHCSWVPQMEAFAARFRTVAEMTSGYKQQTGSVTLFGQSGLHQRGLPTSFPHCSNDPSVRDGFASPCDRGAMDAGLADPLFWGSLALALAVAAAAAFPVNRWLIARGRGHAVVHAHHGHRH